MRASTPELVRATAGEVVQEGPPSIEGVSIDSRTLKAGNLFVAIRGKRYDGHQFASQAVEQGASALLVEEIPQANLPGVTILKVQDTQKALGDLASFHRSRFSPTLIAVTGSNGKTTTKELIAHLLSHRSPTLKNEGTQNNLIGVPLTLFRLESLHSFCVLELGMSQPGEIKRLSEICRPTVGVLLNIGPSHLEFLRDLKGVYHSKMELVPFLAKGAPLVLNAEDPFLSQVHLPHLTSLRFGRGGDFVADQIQLDRNGLRFRLNGKEPVQVPLFGLHHVENCLAALTVVSALGMEPREMIQRLETFQPPAGRMELRERQGITFIHDAYNANPLSVSKALQSFRAFPVEGRRIFVMGDMLELGEEAPRFHEQAGEEAVASGVDLLLTLGDLSLHAFSRAKFLGFQGASHFKSHQELSEELRKILREGDWVLVKGSRSMQMERILEELERTITNNQITITK